MNQLLDDIGPKVSKNEGERIPILRGGIFVLLLWFSF